MYVFLVFFEDHITTNLPNLLSIISAMSRQNPPPDLPRPPNSTSTVASDTTDTEDDASETRYPDFVVMMTTYADTPSEMTSVHSIWEIKRPLDGTTKEKELEEIRDELATRYLQHVLQVVEQVACAFWQYEHQQKITVFLALGVWIRALHFSRQDMPTRDQIEDARALGDAAAGTMLSPYVSATPFFPLLAEQNEDYSQLFKRYWSTAFTNVSADVERVTASNHQH